MLEKESDSQKSSLIGKLFFINIFCLLLFLIVQADSAFREEIRAWIQATGSVFISIAIFYLTQQANARTKREDLQRQEIAAQEKKQREEIANKELLEQQKNNYYRTYLDQVLRFVIQHDFSQPVESSVSFQIAKSLTSTALKEFELERKNQIISFFQDLNAKGELPSKIPIFQKMQLNKADFARLNAVGIDFSGSDLWNVDFVDANLYYAKFMKSELNGANFARAKLKGANFSDAMLENAIFSNDNTQDLQRVNFSTAYLSRVNLSQMGFFRAKFKDSNLTESNLSGSSLIYADLSNAKLIGTDLRGTDFTNANLTGADLTAAIIDETTIFMGANLQDAKFDKSLIIE